MLLSAVLLGVVCIAFLSVSGIPNASGGFYEQVVNALEATPRHNAVILNWEQPPASALATVKEYVVTARMGQVNPYVEVATIPSYSKSVKISNLINGSPYTFVVISRTYDGILYPSGVASATPKAGSEPGSPTNLRIVGTSPGVTSIFISPHLKWDAPNDGGDDIVKYRVIVKSTLIGGSLTHVNNQQTFSGDSTSGVIEDLERHYSHEIRLIAVNSVGEGDPSESLSWTPPQS